MEDKAMNVFVSGGTGGIGRATVLDFLQHGHNVAFSYLQDEAGARQICQEASKRYPERKIWAGRMDVGDSAQVEAQAQAATDAIGDFQALICSAGVSQGELLVSLSDMQWQQILNTNLTGCFYLSRFFLPQFILQKFGRIVFLSSVVANGASGMAAYAASKAGQIGLAKSIGKEYGSRGITANCILAGAVATEMTKPHQGEKSLQFWQQTSPLRREAQAPEIVGGIRYLCSPQASFTNGALLEISSGLSWMV